MRIESLPAANLVGPGELTSANTLSPNLPGRLPGGDQADSVSAPEFSQVFEKALGQVNDLLAEADHQAELVATGQADNLHDALLAMAEADLALQVTMRVTQKAISAYQEVSRMQI